MQQGFLVNEDGVYKIDKSIREYTRKYNELKLNPKLQSAIEETFGDELNYKELEVRSLYKFSKNNINYEYFQAYFGKGYYDAKVANYLQIGNNRPFNLKIAGRVDIWYMDENDFPIILVCDAVLLNSANRLEIYNYKGELLKKIYESNNRKFHPVTLQLKIPYIIVGFGENAGLDACHYDLDRNYKVEYYIHYKLVNGKIVEDRK